MSIRERELQGSSAVGPMLSDGTAVADLVDLESKTVSLRLFSDPEVFRAEQQYLFGRCWNIVAHETEVPGAGDYLLRTIADDSVIVSRDRDGDIHVMLNVCTHRGMQVCRSEAGNANSFKCPYHGWAFDNQGNLLGAPFEREMYGDGLDKPNLGLREARVQLYAGIVFANWDDTAPPLEEFLGEYSWYMDTIFKRTTGGLEAIGAPQRFLIQANWKTASEQFNGADGYHVSTLHRTLLERFLPDGTPLSELKVSPPYGIDIGSRLGHGYRANARARRTMSRRGQPIVQDPSLSALDSWIENPPENLPPELVHQLGDNLTPGQLETTLGGPGGMFPNVGFLSTNIRTHVPLGPGLFEMRNWVLVEKDASPEFKDRVRKEMLHGFGTSGTIEQDDSESWPSIQKSATGFMGSNEKMRYQAFVGHRPPEGWEGGCGVFDGISADDSAWMFWQRYRDYMTGNPFS